MFIIVQFTHLTVVLVIIITLFREFQLATTFRKKMVLIFMKYLFFPSINVKTYELAESYMVTLLRPIPLLSKASSYIYTHVICIITSKPKPWSFYCFALNLFSVIRLDFFSPFLKKDLNLENCYAFFSAQIWK